MIDPNASTPPYDRVLCSALARADADVTLVTSRFLYEDLAPPPDYRVEEAFFRLVGQVGHRLGLADGDAGRRASRASLGVRGAGVLPRVRRALKAAEYPLDWVVLLARLGRARPDIVHVQWAVAPGLDRLIWHVARRLGIPIVYTVHNLLPHATRPGDADRYGRLYRAADAVIVHSRRSARALVERWRVPRESITVTPMGPLLSEERELERGAARRRLGLPPDQPLILFAGLIEPYKGLDDLVAAFARIAESRPAASLVVAGKPNVPLTSIQAMLGRAGVAARTILDARFLPQPELAAYLCAADVVALPYHEATSSAMLLAARRFGCPVVATAVGDLAEVVVDGVSGLLVPPRDPDTLARALDRLLSDPALAARLGAEGKRTTLEVETWDLAARRTLESYRVALERRPSS